MNALESMTAALRTTGIYALTGKTVVDIELQSYAEELNLLYDAISLLEKESFAPTACDYGLCSRMRQYGLPQLDDPEQNRAAVLAMGAVTPERCSKDDLADALRAAGLPCDIVENPAGQALYLNCPQEMADEDTRNAAVRTAKLFLPAHLNAELDFRSISWDTIDRADASFDEDDALNLTWDAVDSYQNAVVRI